MQCKVCNGEGGEREIILDDGTGPWHSCGFCSGTGKTGFIMYLRILWWIFTKEITIDK